MVWFHRGECPRCRGNLGDAWVSVYDPDTPVCVLCHGKEQLEQRGLVPPFPVEQRYWRPYDQKVYVKGFRADQKFGFEVGDRLKIPGIPGTIHLKDHARRKEQVN